MSSGGRGDIFGRIIGMLIFLLGVGLLVFVFLTAFKLFGLSPAAALGLTFTGDPKKDPLLTQIGSNFGWLLAKVGFLFVMAIAGSLVSQKGINLYFSSMYGVPLSSRMPATAAPSPVVHSESHGEAS